MAVYKNISSKALIRKVMRDLKPNTDNWVDDAIEWIGEALEHIGAASQFCTKKTVLDITAHKAVLPPDLYYINQVAINGTVSPKITSELDTLLVQVKDLKDNIKTYQQDLAVVMEETIEERDAAGTDRWKERGENYDTLYKTNIVELNEINSRIIVLEGMFFNVDTRGESKLTPLSYGASTFPDAIHCAECENQISNAKDSYIIDCDYIKTSFPTGKVCLSYTAFPLDEDCFPMVPDDISFKEAIFWYIFKKLLLGGWDKPTNKIDYIMAEKQWLKYCTQARNAANYPDIDKMESFMNQWVRLVPEVNNWELFFEESNTREDLNRSY